MPQAEKRLSMNASPTIFEPEERRYKVYELDKGFIGWKGPEGNGEKEIVLLILIVLSLCRHIATGTESVVLQKGDLAR